MKVLNFLKTLVVIAAVIIVLLYVCPFLAGAIIGLAIEIRRHLPTGEARRGSNGKKE